MIHYLSILAALNSFPVFQEDRGNPQKQDQLAEHALAMSFAVARHSHLWPGSQAELAAVTATIGYMESGYSLRIQRDDCYAWECDGGRARGTYQMHASAVQGRDERLWIALPGLDVGSVELSVDQAVRAVVRARRQCSSLERVGQDWVGMTFHAYGRSTCVGTFKGLDVRVARFHSTLGKIRRAEKYDEPNPNNVLEVSMNR